MRITIRVELDHQDGIEAVLTAPALPVDASSRSDVVATKACEASRAFSLLRLLTDAVQGSLPGGDSLGAWLRDNGIRVTFGPPAPVPTSQEREVVVS